MASPCGGWRHPPSHRERQPSHRERRPSSRGYPAQPCRTSLRNAVLLGQSTANVFVNCMMERIPIGIRCIRGDFNQFVGGTAESCTTYGLIVGATCRSTPSVVRRLKISTAPLISKTAASILTSSTATRQRAPSYQADNPRSKVACMSGFKSIAARSAPACRISSSSTGRQWGKVRRGRCCRQRHRYDHMEHLR